jgi:hypothetical protein
VRVIPILVLVLAWKALGAAEIGDWKAAGQRQPVGFPGQSVAAPRAARIRRWIDGH